MFEPSLLFSAFVAIEIILQKFWTWQIGVIQVFLLQVIYFFFHMAESHKHILCAMDLCAQPVE